MVLIAINRPTHMNEWVWPYCCLHFSFTLLKGLWHRQITHFNIKMLDLFGGQVWCLIHKKFYNTMFMILNILQMWTLVHWLLAISADCIDVVTSTALLNNTSTCSYEKCSWGKSGGVEFGVHVFFKAYLFAYCIFSFVLKKASSFSLH